MFMTDFIESLCEIKIDRVNLTSLLQELVYVMQDIRKCETPTTNISQENGHDILMITCQFVAYNKR